MKNNRYKFIDSLRGIAALYVVLYHLVLVPKPKLIVEGYLSNILLFGSSGVTLFFVISGYCMALTWGNYIHLKNSCIQFYKARFLRIAPLFYFWIIVSLIRDSIFKSKNTHSIFEIISNVTFSYNFFDGLQNSIVWAGWTIGVEMIFYLIFPLLIKYIKYSVFKPLLIATLITLFVAIINTNIGDMPNFITKFTSKSGFIIFIPIFLLGIAAYNFKLKYKNIDTFFQNLILILSIVVLFIIALSETNLVNFYISGLAYGLIVYAASNTGDIIFSNKILSKIGKISYSIYLNHPSIIYILSPVYVLLYFSGLDKNISYLLCAFLTIFIVLPISFFTYNFIEQSKIFHMSKK